MKAKLVRWGSLLGLFAACLYWFYQSQELTRLQDIHQDLVAEVGSLDVRDPDKVHGIQIANVQVPAVVADRVIRAWQFRYYLPANYQSVFVESTGLIASDTPVSQAGGRSSHYNSESEPVEYSLQVAIVKQGDGYRLSTSYASEANSGSSSSDLLDFDPAQLENWVAETAVGQDGATVQLPADQAFCLLRYRSVKSNDTNSVGDKTIDLYPGVSIYWMPNSDYARFQALCDGRPWPPIEGL